MAGRAQTLAGEKSPHIRIDQPWSEFLTGRGKKFRANLKRVPRTVERYGATRMVWYERPEDSQNLLECIFAIELHSWKAQAGIDIEARGHERRYYQLLIPALAANGQLCANVLHVDDKPVAYVLCCRSAAWTGQLKTSFKQAVKDAGAYAIDASVERAFDCNAKVYDFLGDATPHKLKWTSALRPHSSYWIYSGRPLARLAYTLKLILAKLGGITRRTDRADANEEPA
jgi:CelD/BcsL family acetyltransferase involved in cellulose biosynthesis